jgi:gamma-glutamylcyclotransferase (GGCT)/AIG2-like uncharacterized protein YtfP
MKPQLLMTRGMLPLQSGTRPHAVEGAARTINEMFADGESFERTPQADGVFVYGTLKQGLRNRHVIEPFVEPGAPVVKATTNGQLFDWGPYPAMTLETEAGQVRGEFVKVSDEPTALQHLDWLEGYKPGRPDNLYDRTIVPVRLDSGEVKMAWVYHMPPDKAAQRGRAVPSGEWNGPSWNSGLVDE